MSVSARACASCLARPAHHRKSPVCGTMGMTLNRSTTLWEILVGLPQAAGAPGLGRHGERATKREREGGEREGDRRWRRLHLQLQVPPPRLHPCHGSGAWGKCERESGLLASPRRCS